MILAGDIGGTHARLALVEIQNGRFQLISSKVFPSQRYSGLDEIAAEFVKASQVQPTQACFGVPGPVTNGRVETSNLPWIIESKRLADELHIKRAIVINDLEATGWGVGALTPSDLVALNDPPGAQGNQALIAAGTGLGEAGLYWDGSRHRVFVSEGGHCDFAPTNDLEVELFRYLQARYGHVSYERIVSGPGLVNVFEFLRDTGRGQVPAWLSEEIERTDAAAAISSAAIEGRCPLCEQALDIFISVFGGETGNLALKVKATGGVFLAGGIAPKILPRLIATGHFIEAFLRKGRLQRLMEVMPVKVIINDQLALLGAARCALVESAA
jgi:glucokinase